jgi:hypothetical protein
MAAKIWIQRQFVPGILFQLRDFAASGYFADFHDEAFEVDQVPESTLVNAGAIEELLGMGVESCCVDDRHSNAQPAHIRNCTRRWAPEIAMILSIGTGESAS